MIHALIALIAFQEPNTLTQAEVGQGWKLLFDGKSTNGWRNFKAKTVASGWVVKDGALVCAEPENAGDIVTEEQFKWFDLTLEYNLSKGGNSGVMYHVTEQGATTWQTGPEIQLYDHPAQEGVEISGYLYQLYGSKVDASKPAGEWNKLRILISPGQCLTEVNGVKYHEYVLGSEDFKTRVAKSKFSRYPHFGTSGKGSIALQGDHGVVSFRNVKIRPIADPTADKDDGR